MTDSHRGAASVSMAATTSIAVISPSVPDILERNKLLKQLGLPLCSVTAFAEETTLVFSELKDYSL